MKGVIWYNKNFSRANEVLEKIEKNYSLMGIKIK